MSDRAASPFRRGLDSLWTVLSRPQNGKPLLREIDGLRFLAILGTILTHKATFLSKHAPAGLAGLASGDLSAS